MILKFKKKSALILTTTEYQHNVCSPVGPEALDTEVSHHN
jgi:hypothetical protein